MLLLIMAIVLFVVVVVDTMCFLFIEFVAASSLHLLFYLLLFVCVVFYENSAFNSDISKWNTGAVTSMNSSKSFIE